jgi:hypothetical protein
VSSEIADNLKSTCHHKALHVYIPANQTAVDSVQRGEIPLYHKSNFEAISTAIAETNWSEIMSLDTAQEELIRVNINDMFERWYQKLSSIIEEHTPKYTAKGTGRKDPWVDSEVIHIIKEKRRAFSLAQRSSDLNLDEKYHNLTHRCSHLIEEKRTKFLENLINEDKNLKKICELVSGKKERLHIPLIIDTNGSTYTRGQDIANAFNLFFASVYNNSNEQHIETLRAGSEQEEIIISMNDVLHALKEFNYQGAVGDYSIPNIVMKKCGDSLAVPLYRLLSIFVSHKVIPDALKCNKITPIPKTGKPKTIVSSFRPVALSSNIIKVLDMVVNKWLNTHIFNNHSLSNSQYGFVRGRSCETLLIDFLKSIYDAFENKLVKCVDVIMLDLSSAFDKVIHSTLIGKMQDQGFSNELIVLIGELLTNRSQYVSSNGYHSAVKSVTSGVIQGGVTSPTAFNIYVSDLIQTVQSSLLFQYADDTMLLKFISGSNDCANLQTDLDALYQKCHELGLHFNASKSVHVRIQLRQRSIGGLRDSHYKLNGDTVPLVDSCRYLGVILDTYLTFHEHCESRIIKATHCWGKIRSAFRNVRGNILLKLYRIHVLPILEYGVATFTPTASDMQKIEMVQKKITKSITFHLHKEVISGYHNRLSRLKLMSIQNRFYFKIVQMIFKQKIGWGYIASSIETVVFKDVRVEGNIASVPFTRLRHTDQWVISTAVDQFNKLPRYIREGEHFSKFKRECRLYYLNSSFSDSGRVLEVLDQELTRRP